ncbi:MAG: type II secretion system F family protein [Actinobacteria bacterium]|nr:type II secretion system F family protein [Chloroflexota bacterium]MBE3128565.1 type II secretion system F family protein [Actinomycetota bacterium]
MATYNYTVRSSKGEIIKDSIDGEAEDSVISKLKDMGYFIVNITKSKEDKVKRKLPALKIFNRVKTRDIVVFTRQFATMIAAGMSLMESLIILEKQSTNPKLSAIISEIRMDVETGHTLSESMEKHSSVFNGLYVSLIRAGEAGGVMDKTMNDLANYLEKEENIRATISSKTAYPKFVLVFASIITVVIIVFLVPTFQEIYKSMGAELPKLTQVVIFIGGLLKKVYFYAILAVIIFGGRYLFKKFVKSPRGRYVLDKLKISIPRVGDLFKKMSLSRFNRHFGILLATGVPILSALEITKGVAGNIIIDNALDKIRKSIKEGENIADPMSSIPVFPTMMVQMMAVGEKTGTLDEVVIKLADFYENEVTHSIDTLVTILEPLMLLFVAGIIGMIVLSMYLPMFNMYQAMGA